MQTTTQGTRQSSEPVNPYAKHYIIAWALALVFYFLEYAARSSPAVMIPELSAAFGVTVIGVSAVIGTYYYTYSVTNLVAGVALDRAGGKWVIAIGAFGNPCSGNAMPSSNPVSGFAWPSVARRILCVIPFLSWRSQAGDRIRRKNSIYISLGLLYLNVDQTF